MTGKPTKSGQSTNPLNRKTFLQRDIPRAQENIYNYLLDIVKQWHPEDVLEEFRHLFIHHTNTISSNTLPSLYEIVFANQEQEFRNTLKRACYILINNWDLSRHHRSIQKLIQLFDDPIINKQTLSPTLKRLRNWLQAFVQSRDFEELKLFAARYDDKEPIHWAERYTSYLLVSQYIDLKNPLEQRQAARALSRKLKEKFKFDLAMYTARSQFAETQEKLPRNPTGLGDDVLRLIKAIVAKKGLFSYNNLANIFIQQTQNLSYEQFKQSLKKYLFFSVNQKELVYTFSLLEEKLDNLYTIHHEKTIDDALLLRTCNRIIEYLTTENHREPSPIFVSILTQGNPLTLVVVLLKLILICRNAHTHLEARIADLIRYYEHYQELDCQWVVNFFEIFRITMAIYTENIEFNLVSMKQYTQLPVTNVSLQNETSSNGKTAPDLNAYRIFSQHRAHLSVSQEIEALEAMDSLQAFESEEFPSE